MPAPDRAAVLDAIASVQQAWCDEPLTSKLDRREIDALADAIMKLIHGATAPSERDGWRLVPVEITQEMFLAAERAGVSFATQRRVWPIMIAAAPLSDALTAQSIPTANRVGAK